MNRFSALFLACALSLGATVGAHAADVQGIKFEDTAQVAGKNLVLNGAGVRIKVVVKVYALGLYLSEKKTTVADVLAAPGPKRFKMVFMRDLSSDDLGQALLTGINKNLDKEEKSKYVNQLVKLGALFEELPGAKKGDVIIGDLTPGVGTSFTLNGKALGPVLPDPQFYNAILRIWLGKDPADAFLKPVLLGEKEKGAE